MGKCSNTGNTLGVCDVPDCCCESSYPNPFDQLDELYQKARSIMEAKNHDYRGGSGDPYSNFRGSIVYDIDPIIGILLRMQDKTKRLETFARKGNLLVKGESVDDALVDIINYCALIRGLIKEKTPATPAVGAQPAAGGWFVPLGGGC